MSAPDLFGATEPASPTIGLMVKLDRDIDRAQPCCDNIARILPGKPPHAGELRCAACDRHRGWAPHALITFITETARRFGAPNEPPVWRQQEKTTMAFEQKDNTGSVFKNDRKTEETHPDRTGSAMINGTEFWVNGWLRRSKQGAQYLALSFKPKDEQSSETTKPKAKELSDTIPF
jgi:hypothetical protein